MLSQMLNLNSGNSKKEVGYMNVFLPYIFVSVQIEKPIHLDDNCLSSLCKTCDYKQ